MAGLRSDRALARARHLLATAHPFPDDGEFHHLRALALAYVAEAERLDAGSARAAEPDELISEALDAVARDYFARALCRARSRR